MFHDATLFLDQAPAAPAQPVSRIRTPRSEPMSNWPIPGVSGDTVCLVFGSDMTDMSDRNTPPVHKTLH